MPTPKLADWPYADFPYWTVVAPPNKPDPSAVEVVEYNIERLSGSFPPGSEASAFTKVQAIRTLSEVLGFLKLPRPAAKA